LSVAASSTSRWRLASTDQRVVRDLLEGARREDAGRDHGRATVTAKRLAAALELQGPPGTPIAIRDRAIVLLTFASGRRRPEVAGLNVEDLDFERPGFLIVTIRKSKTDQGGAGQFVAVPRLRHGPCAVAAIEAWLAIREQKKGALFVAFSPHGERRETRIEGATRRRSGEAAFSGCRRFTTRRRRDRGAQSAAGVRDVGRYGRGNHCADHGRDGASRSEVAAPLHTPRAAARSGAPKALLRLRPVYELGPGTRTTRLET
jgi:integrase